MVLPETAVLLEPLKCTGVPTTPIYGPPVFAVGASLVGGPDGGAD